MKKKKSAQLEEIVDKRKMSNQQCGSVRQSFSPGPDFKYVKQKLINN